MFVDCLFCSLNKAQNRLRCLSHFLMALCGCLKGSACLRALNRLIYSVFWVLSLLISVQSANAAILIDHSTSSKVGCHQKVTEENQSYSSSLVMAINSDVNSSFKELNYPSVSNFMSYDPLFDVPQWAHEMNAAGILVENPPPETDDYCKMDCQCDLSVCHGSGVGLLQQWTFVNPVVPTILIADVVRVLPESPISTPFRPPILLI